MPGQKDIRIQKVNEARHSATVCRMNGKLTGVSLGPGDPTDFSRFNAAAALAGMPLADTDDTVAIIPVGYGITMIEHLLKDFDTLVLLKVKPLLDDIIDLLERKSLLEQSCFIEKAGSAEEKLFIT